MIPQRHLQQKNKQQKVNNMDVVNEIRSFNAGREQERLQLKFQKMRVDAFSFLRGTCHLFYSRLAEIKLIKSAPIVWVCGDLHLENFGSYKGGNRLAYFDVNDFDEAALAPASWDLVRLLASVLVGADSLSIRLPEAEKLCTIFLESYGSALEQGKAYWIENETAQGLIRDLLESLKGRKRARFIRTRTVSQGQTCALKIDGQKTLAVTDAQRAAVTAFMRRFAKTQSQPKFFQVLDVARRIAGTGTLGVQRYVILIQGKGSIGGHYLLDLKQSLGSCVAPHFESLQPTWHSQAHRVVELQRRMQAMPVAMLHPVQFEGSAYVLRELQPTEDRVSLDRATQNIEELETTIKAMGQMLAWAQLRSAGRNGSATADELIHISQRKKWKEKLLAASHACAQQVKKDAAVFNRAFDSGALNEYPGSQN